MQVIGTGRVDHQAVGRVGSDDRRVALQRPERQAFERFCISRRIGVHDDKICDERLGLRGSHARPQVSGYRRSIRREHHAPAFFATDEDERRFSRWRCVAELAPQAIRGPAREEERYDPWHLGPPLRNLHFRRRGSG